MADKSQVYIILLIFSGLAVFSTYQVHQMLSLYTEIVHEVGEGFTKRDEWTFEIASRLQTLESQRDLERRLTNLERSTRIFCLEGKLEMCATLTPVQETP